MVSYNDIIQYEIWMCPSNFWASSLFINWNNHFLANRSTSLIYFKRLESLLIFNQLTIRLFLGFFFSFSCRCPYLSLLFGKLINLMVTLPNIAYMVGLFSLFMHATQENYWHVALSFFLI